jgi:predicted dehydrogenase
LTAALSLPAISPSLAPAFQASPRKYRVAVIGHTGQGDYGHDLDKVWLDVPGAEIVAVADANEQGLAAAVKRLNAPKGYSDYRRMLDEAKPELVSICTRWLDQRRDMVIASAERGVRGIYLETPLARTLAEADAMIAACEKNKVKAAIAHQTRYSPKLPVIRALIASGKLGKLLELRARGKEDSRGGGEDLWVLGTHVLDLMHSFGGAPQWCFGAVCQEGRPVRKDDVQPGAEGIGPLAGDEVHATYRLSGGAMGFFDSVRNGGGRPPRFGITLYGTKGVLSMGTNYMPPVHFLPDSSWLPGQTRKQWLAVSSAGVDKPEPIKDGTPHQGNVAAVQNLIAAIEKDAPTEASFGDARLAIEMIVAVFESQRVGGPVTFPLNNRENPLTMLK